MADDNPEGNEVQVEYVYASKPKAHASDDDAPRSGKYSDEFKQQVFDVWYRNGKPTPAKLRPMLLTDRDPITHALLSQRTLLKWVGEDFPSRAIVLDDQVVSIIENRLISEKVEMLDRHAIIGQRMQQIALEYFEQHEINSPKVAVALLVQGVKIEREARSVPKLLAEITKKSDEELLNDLRDLSGQGKLLDGVARDVAETSLSNMMLSDDDDE